MTHWEQLAADNKKIIMEIQNTDRTDLSKHAHLATLRAQMKENTDLLQMYAAALPDRNSMPRIVLNKTRFGDGQRK